MSGYRSPATREAGKLLQDRARKIEREREKQVRKVKCPVCPAEPGQVCSPVLISLGWAHTGRYNLAARAGLVPALPGQII